MERQLLDFVQVAAKTKDKTTGLEALQDPDSFWIFYK